MSLSPSQAAKLRELISTLEKALLNNCATDYYEDWKDTLPAVKSARRALDDYITSITNTKGDT